MRPRSAAAAGSAKPPPADRKPDLLAEAATPATPALPSPAPTTATIRLALAVARTTQLRCPLSATQPNDPLSRRGMPRGTFTMRDEGPGRLQRLVRRGRRPSKAATIRLPHRRPRGDRAPAGRPRGTALTAPTPHRRTAAAIGLHPARRSPRPRPLSAPTSTCRRQRTRTPSGDAQRPPQPPGPRATTSCCAGPPSRPRSAAAIGSALTSSAARRTARSCRRQTPRAGRPPARAEGIASTRPCPRRRSP